MEQKMRQIINDCYMDLEAACAECGEGLDAESLADFVGDRMCDESPEYRAMPWEERRAMTLRIAQQYC